MFPRTLRFPLTSLGSDLFHCSHLTPHYIGYWTRHRLSIMHFNHQATFNYFTQLTGEHPYLFEDMPQWFQKSTTEKSS